MRKGELLASSELFAGIPRDRVQALADVATSVDVAAGGVLIEQGERAGELYWVERGAFAVEVVDGEGAPAVVKKLGETDLFGELQFVTGGVRSATVRATEASRVIVLPREAIERALRDQPDAHVQLLNNINRRLLRVELDNALRRFLPEAGEDLLDRLRHRAEWCRLVRGESLFRTGDAPDGWYLVLSGRLLLLQEVEGSGRVVGAVGRGESVGEIGVLEGTPRTMSLIADRESWLARFSRDSFEKLLLERPDALRSLLHTFARRLAGASSEPEPEGEVVAVVPVDEVPPLMNFARQLAAELGRFANVECLTAETCEELGIVSSPRTLAMNDPSWLRLGIRLDDSRRRNETVLMIADEPGGRWTERAMAEADRILLIGRAGGAVSAGPPPVSTDEHTAVPRWLVLLHPKDARLPLGTAAWLDAVRPDAHFHCREGHAGDHARLARFAGGHAVGIALSGGGARGAAHAGVVFALAERGIPIDYIAGASAGALMASLLAFDEGEPELAKRLRGVMRFGNPFGDYTLPMISILRSRRIRDGVQATFGDVAIEDLWLPLSIVTTNLSSAEMNVHERGPLSRIALASASPPGVTEPVAIDGQMHCDGGVSNNLPFDLVAKRGCRIRLASSVESKLSLELPDQGFPGPWSLLWDRSFAGEKRFRKVPGVMEIVVRAMTLAGAIDARELEREADLLFRPDVDDFALLDFSRTDALLARGRAYAATKLDGNPWVDRTKAELGLTDVLDTGAGAASPTNSSG